MPSRPLSPDRAASVRLQTRLDVEAINVAKDRTDRPAAVGRLALFVPPARTDIVDGVLVAVGRRDPVGFKWPPISLVHELAFRVKRFTLGEVRLRGPGGEVVDVIRYTDKMGYDRRVYRLHQRGVFIGEYKTPEELGKVVDLATLVEDEDATGGSRSPVPPVT